MSRDLKDDDVASVARLPGVTLEGITIDDAFIQQQEAIMRDLGNNTVVERMGKASSPPPARRGRIFKNNPTGKIPPPFTSSPSQDELSVDASNMSKEHLDTNFCDIWNDVELIREQRRIFEAIQRQHETKPSAIIKDDLYTSKNPTQNQVENFTDPELETSTRQGFRRMQHLQTATTSTAIDQTHEIPDKFSKTVPSDKVVASSQDRVTRLHNGKKIRVKGTQHAYMSIARGTAIIVTCPCCQTVSQVDASTKLLYCTRCQNVSPIELATSSTNNGNNVGLCDYQIAGSVQQQEIDVAFARKMSKMQH
jgi:hypothetical protein